MEKIDKKALGLTKKEYSMLAMLSFNEEQRGLFKEAIIGSRLMEQASKLGDELSIHNDTVSYFAVKGAKMAEAKLRDFPEVEAAVRKCEDLQK